MMAEFSNLEKAEDIPMSLKEANDDEYGIDRDTDLLVTTEDGELRQENGRVNAGYRPKENIKADNTDKGPAPPIIPRPDYDDHDDGESSKRQPPDNLSAVPQPVMAVFEETPSLTAHEELAAPVTSEEIVVEMEGSLSDANKTKTAHKEELMFRMKMAHLAPCEVNWVEELKEACEGHEDSEIPDQVLDSLREFPMSMAEKLSLTAHLRGKQRRRFSQNGVSVVNRNRVSQISSNGAAAVVSGVLNTDSFGTLGFWDQPIGKIGARFGTNVASYFKFLRFIAVINAWSAVVMFCFVSLPEIIPNELINDEIHPGFFAELSQSIFFFGAYSNTSLNDGDVGDGLLVYDRPLAYFLTWSSVYILSILFIVLIMYAGYRRSKQSFSDASSRYSAAVLVGWDHSVTTKEGCRLEASAFSTYIREMTIEDRERKKLSCWDGFVLTLNRVLSNVVCLAIMGGSGYFIYFVADKASDTQEENVTDIKDFFEKYQLTILVSALKIIIPPVLSLPLFFERWHPRTNIKLQLGRTAVFYAASLLSFIISVYSMSIKCEKKTNDVLTTSTTPITTVLSTTSPANGTNPRDEDYCCWENEVGQQIFQVVILDFVVNVGVALVTMAGRAVVVDKCFRFRKLGQAEFKVPSEILDLVYSQSLIWLGLYTAPFLALVGFTKLIIQFYFFYYMATRFCEPPSSVFRASRSGGFFRFVLLATLFFCMFPLTYMIISLEPSNSCGPYKTQDRVYEVLTDKIGEAPDWLRTVVVYISTPAVVIPVVILLVLLVFYYRVKSSTQRKTARNIRRQFKMKRQLEKKQLFSKNRTQRGL